MTGQDKETAHCRRRGHFSFLSGAPHARSGHCRQKALRRRCAKLNMEDAMRLWKKFCEGFHEGVKDFAAPLRMLAVAVLSTIFLCLVGVGVLLLGQSFTGFARVAVQVLGEFLIHASAALLLAVTIRAWRIVLKFER
jgi:hypothetical protein